MEEIKTLEPPPEKGWFKILGIGKEGCMIASELSKKRHYLRNDEFFSMKEKDFLCIKGIKNIDELQNYLPDRSIVWYVTSGGKAYEDVLKEVLKTVSPKVDYSLLFNIGKFDKKFAYSLTAKGYINHFIVTTDNTYDKTLKAMEGLLFLLFGYTLIGIDFYDVKLAFSVSPFIKADVMEVPKESIRNSKKLELLFKNFRKLIKEPTSMVLSIIIPRDGTLDEAYRLATFINEKFKASLLHLPYLSPDSKTELFFFSTACDEELPENSDFRVTIFWTEKKEMDKIRE